MIVVFILLVDDFARSKIINYLAPCRSTGRFGLDVIIGFFLGFAFMMIEYESSFFFLSLSMYYIFRTVWSRKVFLESMEWEKLTKWKDEIKHPVLKKCFNDPEITRHWSKIQGNYWTPYRSRLYYIQSSNLVMSGVFAILFAVVAKFDSSHVHWNFYAPCVTALLVVAEGHRYFAEEKIAREAEIFTGWRGFFILKTFVWMPDMITEWLRKLARDKVGRDHPEVHSDPDPGVA